MKNRELSPLGRIFAERRQIEAAMKAGIKDAIRLHKLAGVPMAIWRDGKVALVPAEELEKKRSRKATGTTKRPARQKRAS